MTIETLAPRKVVSLPEPLQPGVLYISERFNLAGHLCACGCGREVITPLSDAQWHLKWHGERVSISPSIGNSNFPCRSHYFIVESRIVWSNPMTDHMIAYARAADEAAIAGQVERENRRRGWTVRLRYALGKIWKWLTGKM